MKKVLSSKKTAKFIFLLGILAVVFFDLYIINFTLSPKLPVPGKEAVCYSNQCGDDLRMIFLSALKTGKESIHLVSFGLSDPSILGLLKKKEKEDVPMHIYYDKKASPALDKRIKGAKSVKSKGLMHQKILVVDHKMVLLGSANMTQTSLSMHDNLCVGFISYEIAKFLEEKTPFSQGHIASNVGGQPIELYLLPDKGTVALEKLRFLIQNAKTTIKVAMFVLTHPLLTDELIQAHKRGVSVIVACDSHCALGYGAKILEKLRREKIPVLVSTGTELFHHKHIYIDENILVIGSANWTASAFKKNTDCFLILYNLTPTQKKFLNKLQAIIEGENKKT